MTTRYNPNDDTGRWYEDVEVAPQTQMPTSKPGNTGVIIAVVVFIIVSLVII